MHTVSECQLHQPHLQSGRLRAGTVSEFMHTVSEFSTYGLPGNLYLHHGGIGIHAGSHQSVVFRILPFCRGLVCGRGSCALPGFWSNIRGGWQDLRNITVAGSQGVSCLTLGVERRGVTLILSGSHSVHFGEYFGQLLQSKILDLASLRVAIPCPNCPHGSGRPQRLAHTVEGLGRFGDFSLFAHLHLGSRSRFSLGSRTCGLPCSIPFHALARRINRVSPWHPGLQ